jgi:hypothetical protein
LDNEISLGSFSKSSFQKLSPFNGDLSLDGEQTYCRNQLWDKESKTVLGQNVESVFLQMDDMVQNAEFDQTV